MSGLGIILCYVKGEPVLCQGVLDELRHDGKLLTLPQHTDPLDALSQIRAAFWARSRLVELRDAEASLAHQVNGYRHRYACWVNPCVCVCVCVCE